MKKPTIADEKLKEYMVDFEPMALEKDCKLRLLGFSKAFDAPFAGFFTYADDSGVCVAMNKEGLIAEAFDDVFIHVEKIEGQKE